MGAFEQVKLAEGASAPLYLLRYDAQGRLASPEAEAHLRSVAGSATDVFLFSHGWNNVFGQALERYRHFIAGYVKQRADLGLPVAQPYQPVLVGVVWPSTSFVSPAEQGPDIAAEPDARETEELLRFVTESLEPAAAARLCELVDAHDRLTEEQARRAAGIVRDGLAEHTDEDAAAPAPTVESVLAGWARLDGAAAPPTSAEDFGAAAPVTVAAAPRSAGLASFFNPTTLLRQATVWKMKRRSGTVGYHGVGPLVRYLLDRTPARLHLIGHSFGARLLLSALASGPVARPARSLLLLQAAVNRWCFAAEVPGADASGGYHPVLARVEQPILATYSPHDLPLREIFQLAMLGDHVGEPQIAGLSLSDEERYGALGGYGPAGLGAAAADTPVKQPGDPYAFPPGVEVTAVDGGATINGHGDISNPSTWWMLHCLAGAG